MDKRIERSLEENTGITEEFEELSKDCFERIFDMLGKRNFERWIDKRKLSPRIKELVIESMGEKEKKENPHWGGYYIRGKNKIRLRKPNSTTATHEKFHFITDNGDNFPTFIDEGLTEYLKSMAEGKVTAYHENVDIVKFLHYVAGDSIIKAYLLGAQNVFDNKIASMLVGENAEKVENPKKALEEFYNNLDVFHESNTAQTKYNNAKKLPEGTYSEDELTEMKESAETAKGKYLEIKDDIGIFIQRLAVSKIAEMAKNLEFYQNGVLDISLANKEILNVLSKMPLQVITNNMTVIGVFQQSTATLAMKEVIKNSHLVNPSETEQEEIEELANKMAPIITFSSSTINRSPANISKDDPIFRTDNPEALETILNRMDLDEVDIITYLEKLAIIQEKFYISDSQMDYILTKHNIDRLANSQNALKINTALKEVFPVFRTLYKLERHREQDTVSTREETFRGIGKDRYIELRDNQKFFVEIEEDGSSYEEELKYGQSTIFRGKDRLDINYKNGMDDVEVLNNGKKVKPGPLMSFKMIKETILSKAITKSVLDKISSNEYTTILNDAPNPYEIDGIRYTGEVDTRSRKIDFKKLIDDFKGIQECVPESVRQAMFDALAFKLFDATYGTGPRKNEKGFWVRENNVIDAYEEFKDNFEKMFKADVTEKDKEKYLRRLEETTSELNKIRKERVEESAKTAAISFETPEAKNRYFKYLEEKRNKAKIEEENALQKGVLNFNYSDCIDYQEDNEHPEYHLSGVYTTGDIDTRDRQVKVEKFAENIKVFLETVPEEKKTEIFGSIFNQMMVRAYGIGNIDLDNDKQLALAAENIRNAINSNVFEGKTIHEESLIPDLEKLNGFHKELAEDNKKHTLIGFKDENTRRMYDVIRNLLKSGTSENEVTDQVRTLIEIHNEMMRGKDAKENSQEK